MKKKEKRLILILVIITIIAIIIMVTNKNKKQEDSNQTVEQNTTQTEEKYVDVLDDGTKLNKSSKLQEVKKIDGMEISDFQITQKDNVTVLLGTITNKTNQTKGDYPISIKILDDQGNEITTVGGYIGKLDAGESTQLNCSATFDYANAYDFEITKK